MTAVLNETSTDCTLSAPLPVLNLQALEHPDTRDQALEYLAKTARETGFFYLEGHGVTTETQRRTLAAAQKFFSLPFEKKQTIALENSRHFRGYTAVGGELTRQQPDQREQIDFGEELPPVPLGSDTPAWWGLQGPNQWPETAPELQAVILEWMHTLRGVADRLLHAFLVALGQSPNALDALVSAPFNHRLKIVHYPGQPVGLSDQGVGAHKDGGLLTLLLQDQVGGLQVETPRGWIDVPPRPDAFVVNIGEMLELATNGYLRANVHRVVSPKSGTGRYSIAYFYAPSLHAEHIPLLVLPPHLALQAQGPESDPLNPLFRHIGKNALKSRIRSHREAAALYYPEQLQEYVPAAFQATATA